MIEIIRIFFTLMFLHALADFSLQSDAMAKGKNRLTQIRIKEMTPEAMKRVRIEHMTQEEISDYEKKWDCSLDEVDTVSYHLGYRLLPNGQKFVNCWFYWMSAHALIHGGIIALVFPEFWYLGLIEVIIHFIIDFMKCQNKLNPHQDQFLHFIFRIMYLINIVI